MVKKFYMYSVWDGKCVLKTEELQSKLLNQNWLLLATCDTICGFTCLEKWASGFSDFPWLGPYILPKDFIKAKWLQKLSCFVHNVLFYIWISLMCKGQPICLLSIPRNNHVLDTGQINWAGWKPAQLLVVASSCSMAMAVANSRGRLKVQPYVWICSFSPLSSPCHHSSLCTCQKRKMLSGADVHVTSGPNHPNPFPCWFLLPAFRVKWGNLCSFANEARVRTVTRAGFFQQRRTCASYVRGWAQGKICTAWTSVAWDYLCQ